MLLNSYMYFMVNVKCFKFISFIMIIYNFDLKARFNLESAELHAVFGL